MGFGGTDGLESYTERELILEKQMELLPEKELVKYISSYYENRSFVQRFSERVFGTTRPLEVRVAERVLGVKRTKHLYDFDGSFS